MPMPLETDTIPRELFHQFRWLIFKHAKAAAISCALPVEDLEAQARLVFCEAVRSYRPDMGACFCTHLTTQLQRLSHYPDREMASRQRYFSMGDKRHHGTDGHDRTWEETFGQLDEILRDADVMDALPRLDSDAAALAVELMQGAHETERKSRHKPKPLTKRGAHARVTRAMGWEWQRHAQAWDGLANSLRSFRKGEDF